MTSVDATALFFVVVGFVCFVFVLLFCLNLLSFLLPKALVFTFIIFLGYEGIIKNNTSCCECTSNNQTSIVLLCHNVQFIYLYIYSGKKKRRKRKEKNQEFLQSIFFVSPDDTRDKEEKE